MRGAHAVSSSSIGARWVDCRIPQSSAQLGMVFKTFLPSGGLPWNLWVATFVS